MNTEYKENITATTFMPYHHKETREWGLKNRFSG
jgi:hypothetical protein